MVESMMGEMISKENMYPPLKEISGKVNTFSYLLN
jgi:hypothetical protein